MVRGDENAALCLQERTQRHVRPDSQTIRTSPLGRSHASRVRSESASQPTAEPDMASMRPNADERVDVIFLAGNVD